LGKGYTLVCHDECSIHLETEKAKVWAKKGSKPIKFISGTKVKVNIGGFYTENKEFYNYDLGETQNTLSFIESLKKFKKDINQKVFLLIDKASFHTYKDAKAYLDSQTDWLEYGYFSTAAPDKNPVEFCWKRTRQELLQLYSFSNKKDLLKNLSELWKDGFFTHKITKYLSL
jgi:putative transposase